MIKFQRQSKTGDKSIMKIKYPVPHVSGKYELFPRMFEC